MSSESQNQSFLADVYEIFSKIVRQAGPYMTASYTLVGAILGLGLLGYFIDGWLHTSPWLFLLGIVLGVVIGFYELAKITLKK